MKIRARIKRSLSAVLAGIGMWLGFAAPPVQAAVPDPPPAAWLAYAELVNKTLTTWLSDKGEVPQRLRAYIDGLRATPDAPPPPIRVRVWIDPRGTITQIDSPLFAQPQAGADLRSILVGRELPRTPPKDMIQPLRLELQLQSQKAQDKSI